MSASPTSLLWIETFGVTRSGASNLVGSGFAYVYNAGFRQITIFGLSGICTASNSPHQSKGKSEHLPRGVRERGAALEEPPINPGRRPLCHVVPRAFPAPLS